MLEALRDIEIASEFLDSKGEDTDDEEDPLDTHYKKLHCDIKPIPHDSSHFKLVEKYLQQTHAPTHTVQSRTTLFTNRMLPLSAFCFLTMYYLLYGQSVYTFGCIFYFRAD